MAIGIEAAEPTYFFHTVDGGRDLGREGMRLLDSAAARNAAITFAGPAMHDEPEILWHGRDYRLEVTKEAGKLLFRIIMLSVDAPGPGQS